MNRKSHIYGTIAMSVVAVGASSYANKDEIKSFVSGVNPV